MKTVLELEELANKAVKAALDHNWQTAVDLNTEYLSDSPRSIEATNRLARAYQELGQLSLSKQTYQQVLELDPYNTIARKNLDKLEQGKTTTSTISTELFLEEPGKTRTASIANPQLKHIAQYASGQVVNLEVRQGQMALISTDGHLLGYLDDALGSHLANLTALGNTYSAHLMTTTDNPQVFLREVSQSAAASKFISFTKAHSGLGLAGNHKDHHLTNDDLDSAEPNSDEDLDNWDESSDEPENPDDDFNAISLEQLRDEEDDTSYNNSEY